MKKIKFVKIAVNKLHSININYDCVECKSLYCQDEESIENWSNLLCNLDKAERMYKKYKHNIDIIGTNEDIRKARYYKKKRDYYNDIRKSKLGYIDKKQ